MRSLFSRIQATLLLLLIVAVAPTRAAENTRRDGNWWRQQSSAAKPVYVLGVFDGMKLGRSFALLDIKTKDYRDDIPCIIATGESYDAFQRQYVERVSHIQISEGLDKLYEDSRNRKISVEDAVWLVLNSISGKSKQETLIDNLRKRAP